MTSLDDNIQSIEYSIVEPQPSIHLKVDSDSISDAHSVKIDSDDADDLVTAPNTQYAFSFNIQHNHIVLRQEMSSLGKIVFHNDGCLCILYVYMCKNDHRSDLVVANYGSDSVDILLGYDLVKFTDQFILSLDSGGFTSIAVGDFNNDNRSDIVVSNKDSSGVFLFLGYGNGTFTSPNMYSTGSGSYPYSIAVGDFNNDRRLDIVVANYYMNNVGILLGYGNGTFADQSTYSTDYGPRSVAVGDYNNDSRLDIVVVNQDAENVGVSLGYGNGTFANQMTYSTGSGSDPYSVAVGDFSNDNKLDIVVANYGTNNIGVLLGYGDGTFANQTAYSTDAGSNPMFVTVGDFNNDNLLDMTVFDDYRLYVFLGSAYKAFLDVKTFSTGSVSTPYSVSVGDFNNDDQVDIVVANSGSGNVGILLGLGYGVFENQTTYSTGNGSIPYSVAVGDFNNDTRLDICVANYGTGNVGIFLGYGNGSFASQTIYLTDPTSYPVSIVDGDMNNDTRLVIVITNYGSNYVVIIFGIGDGTFVNKTEILMGYGARPGFVGIADVNNDTLLEIAVINYGSGNIEIISKTC